MVKVTGFEPHERTPIPMSKEAREAQAKELAAQFVAAREAMKKERLPRPICPIIWRGTFDGF